MSESDVELLERMREEEVLPLYVHAGYNVCYRPAPPPNPYDGDYLPLDLWDTTPDE